MRKIIRIFIWLFIIGFIFGMVGFMGLFNLDIITSMYNTAAIISLVDIEVTPENTIQKLFITSLILFSGFILLAIGNYVFVELIKQYDDD